MLTIKLHITSVSDSTFIKRKQTNYSCAFRYLYKRIEESKNKDVEEFVCKKFHLNTIEFRSVLSEVESFFKRNESTKNKRIKQLADKTSLFESLKQIAHPTKFDKRNIFRLHNQIQFLKRSIKKDAVFGGKKLLQEISYLSNKVANEQIEKIIGEKKTQYQKNRTRSFHVLGEANQKGNRFFDFSKMEEGIIIYKPKAKKRIEIKFLVPRNKKLLINQLQTLSNQGEIALSISLSNESIHISYDELIVAGFNFDNKGYQAELVKLKHSLIGLPKEEQSRQIKALKKSFFDKQRTKMLVGKKVNRTIAIDLNPEFIGWSILDRVSETKQDIRVIDTGCYDLSNLCKKLPREATSSDRKYQNNKRRHEINQAIIGLFDKAIHFKCASFVMEDLNFKIEVLNGNSKEANRKIKNIWNRVFIENLIRKFCNVHGMELIEVKPQYSSFIGNIMNDRFDPISSSIELGRRGLYRFIKNLTGYPTITEGIINTVETIIKEQSLVFDKDVLCLSNGGACWKNLYNASKQFRWRRVLDPKKETRSRVKHRSSKLFIIR